MSEFEKFIREGHVESSYYCSFFSDIINTKVIKSRVEDKSNDKITGIAETTNHHDLWFEGEPVVESSNFIDT
ncbi:MAG: hypothetical protein CVU89_03185 [Firmicutes bacterium HGW-Firmicutes-14]|nr:MAG: hypothetical protein CVU89_03185 [Firmicutes bacterium HGW-Firmicutes-14]